MSRIQKLKLAKVSDDTKVRLKYSDGGSVIHSSDDFEDVIVYDTCIANHLSEMINNPSIGNAGILKEMRDAGLLDEYERGSFEFESYVAEVIAENWRDYDWIETTTERYDYKRGHTEVSVVVETKAENIYNMADFELAGWDIEIDHPLGVLEIEED
jgi:hypothetical protein